MAVVYCVKFWHIYLYGVEFTIITDHWALKWILSIKDPEGRLARWAIVLSMYLFVLIHRAGRIHSNVDILSRPVLPIEAAIDEIRLLQNEDERVVGVDIYEDEPLIH